MAWAERTFHTVTPPNNEVDAVEEQRLNKILKNMPPFIKLSSRRARRALVAYEEMKQRHIEALRENAVFKFVMLVAGLTNERIDKYWKGNSVSPFSESHAPRSTNIDKEDLEILIRRAREKAFADLHQFCKPIKAIPMYRRARQAALRPSENDNFTGGETPLPDGETEAGLYGPTDGRADDPAPGPGAAPPTENFPSAVKYVYNMSDSEFYKFCQQFVLTPKSIDEAYRGRNTIRWYILGRDDAVRFHGEDNGENPFPAHNHFRGQEVRTYGQEWYNDRRGVGTYPRNEAGVVGGVNVAGRGVPVTEGSPARRPANHSTDRIYDHTRVFDEFGDQQDTFDHPDEYITLRRSNWWDWSDSVPVVRWDTDYPEFWFQRYIARWLAREGNSEDSNNSGLINQGFRDLSSFKNRYQLLFNNLRLDASKKFWIRDLTGLRLTKMIRGSSGETRSGQARDDPELFEGELDMERPCQTPCEVPLDFVRPLFNERFAYWKHELVIGEYEKRTMYEADQWLQKTPWAIGKIYLQPSIYAHMQEAHVAICSKYKKFESLSLQDWLASEEHRFFFSKLVAMCIRTSAVLSNKKYGLDKAYMRLNLEKRRLMYAIGKLKAPQRVQNQVNFPRAGPRQRAAWEAYRAARERGDTAAAAAALQLII